MSLTAPALSELTLQSGVKALLSEWLRSWFDGQEHAVGDNAPVVFPELGVTAINFDQGPAPQPMADAASESGISVVDGAPGQEIRMTFQPLGFRRDWDQKFLGPTGSDARLIQEEVAIIFLVACRLHSMAESNLQADQTTQLLGAILRNPAATAPLAEKGVHRLRPSHPRTIAGENLALRMLYCRAELGYRVRWTASG